LQVEIVLAGSPAGVAQPVHIHAGGCGDDLGNVVYPLDPVLDGKSTTLLRRVSLADVAVGHAINVHRSRDDIATYVACGMVDDGAAESDSGVGGRVESGPAALPRTGRGELLGMAATLGVALGLVGLGLRRRWAI